MSTDFRPQDDASATVPIDLDEGYWAALLQEGEYTRTEPPGPAGGDGWETAGRRLDNVVSETASLLPSQQDWDLAETTYRDDQTVELVVTGYNRGGLLVSWNSLRGFVPASQLVGFPIDIDENLRRDMLARQIGRKLQLRIIELDRGLNRLILSERAGRAKPGQRVSMLNSLQPGTVCKGTVTNLCDFGAFVDLGGVEGLIHISELSWGRVGHPRDVLSSGQNVEVYVMSVDRENERIALSLKRLQPDPWASVEQRYKVGQIVEGVITNVVDFGAFACIEEGLEGLIHISELAEGQFLHPRNVVREGERVTARILNIDGPSRRLGLSLRKLGQDNHSN